MKTFLFEGKLNIVTVCFFTTMANGIVPYIRGNDKRFDLLSMPVEDLVNVAEDDFILAFHACRH